jgi:hypothetical protein
MYVVILTARDGLHHPVSQEGFKSALKSAFEHFLNLKHSQSAYLIAKFVDKQLKGEKGTTEQEVEARLDQVRSVVPCAWAVCPVCCELRGFRLHFPTEITSSEK